jgi:PIN domain nuclease of toxin-antitoxin system
VTLLDAYALVAFVADEPAAGEVEQLLRAGGCGLTTVNLAEAIDVARRVHGLQEEDLRGLAEPLLDDALVVIPTSEAQAWRSADLRARYYDRRLSPLSIADCFLLAAAGLDDEVATADPVVAEVARVERIAVNALPDTAGQRP